jgi:hypothetical protein
MGRAPAGSERTNRKSVAAFVRQTLEAQAGGEVGIEATSNFLGLAVAVAAAAAAAGRGCETPYAVFFWDLVFGIYDLWFRV